MTLKFLIKSWFAILMIKLLIDKNCDIVIIIVFVHVSLSLVLLLFLLLLYQNWLGIRCV